MKPRFYYQGGIEVVEVMMAQENSRPVLKMDARNRKRFRKEYWQWKLLHDPLGVPKAVQRAIKEFSFNTFVRVFGRKQSAGRREQVSRELAEIAFRKDSKAARREVIKYDLRLVKLRLEKHYRMTRMG